MSLARRSAKAHGARPPFEVAMVLPRCEAVEWSLLHHARMFCGLSIRDRRRRGIESSWSSSAGTVGTVIENRLPEDVGEPD
jgi:hypothetical protein